MEKLRAILKAVPAVGLLVASCTGNIGDSVSSGPGGSSNDDQPVLTPTACGTAGLAPTPTLRLTDEQYANAIRDLFDGLIEPSAVFPETVAIEAFKSDPDANVVSQLAAEDILIAAEEVGAAAADRIEQILPCAATAADTACARSYIDDFGRRAFRRPLTAEERNDLVGLYEEVSADMPFEARMGVVISAMLQMPQFLYVLESGFATGQAGIVALNDYELAQRLSLLFLDSIPDAELSAAADSGQLRTPAQLEAHARRLLAKEEAVPAMAGFFAEWLKVEAIDPLDKDAALFTTLDAALASAINREFSEFSRMILRDMDGRLDALLTSRTTMVNRTLAEFYGLDPSVSANDEDWVQVELPATERTGVLSRAAVLATHAHRTRTSPVFRGKLVRTQFLCNDVPNPPPDALARAPSVPDDATPRERSNIIRSVDECAGCHQLMDPIGLGFENYDALGGFRQSYSNGSQVDNAGQFFFSGEQLDTFAGVIDLSEQLANDDTVKDCVPKQMFRFMYGRREAQADTCSLDVAASRFSDSNYDLRELIVSMVLTDTFRFRSVAGD